MVDKALILRKISELEEHLKELDEFKDITVEIYSKDWKIQRIIERTLQITIEICIDIANHIISEEGFRIPSSYSDTFKVLYEKEIINNELLEIMERMVRFRNIIVHNYDKIDPGIVVNIIKKNLNDFIKYKDHIISYLKRRI
ncbi:MAG: DUF86 domain-containing protein [Dictyoglomus sp.]|nr:DUF86 domain-containing protein [Dictyoglomus sp.]MDW8189176.1 DUF86 domain-containing protein [Dictyoglomus sp.]